MAQVLTNKQTKEINRLRTEFKPYEDLGWMCEGSDYEEPDGTFAVCNSIFNNKTDEYIFACFNGEILIKQLRDTSEEDAQRMADIQGKISLIVEEAYGG